MTDKPPKLTAPPWASIEWSIMRAAREIRKSFDAIFNDFGLNLSGAALLALVMEHGPLSQTKLGTSLQMGRASAGALVDDLETRGIVRRQASPSDKRVWLVELTDEGQELANQIEQRHRKLRDEYPKVAIENDLSKMTVTLDLITDNLQQQREKKTN
tara:strand:+ start:21934 stop:22404 length:471 start_codon:yes stop_codon:yes gene_type:complete